jgi:hypothetical protein
MTKTRIIVDADACPVKHLIERAAARRQVDVVMVTATAMRRRAPGVEVIRVDAGPDSVDDWIIAHCRPGDIVVTQDIPLAAAVLQRAALVIENRGEELTPDNIGDRLAMRDLVVGLRDAGLLDQSTGGPRPLRPSDKSRFAQTLGRLLDRVQRSGKTLDGPQ